MDRGDMKAPKTAGISIIHHLHISHTALPGGNNELRKDQVAAYASFLQK